MKRLAQRQSYHSYPGLYRSHGNYLIFSRCQTRISLVVFFVNDITISSLCLTLLVFVVLCVCMCVCVCVCVCVLVCVCVFVYVCLCEGMGAPAFVLRYKHYCFSLLSVTFCSCTEHVWDKLYLAVRKYVKYACVLSTTTIVQSFNCSIHISNQ